MRLPARTLTDGPFVPVPANPRWRRIRRRGLILLGLAGTIGLLVAFHRPILVGYAGWFRVDDPARSDAIVLLLGGISHRPGRAAQLYRAGLAPVIVLGQSRQDDPLDPDETARTVALLVSEGVPRSAIRVLPGVVTSTREEANGVAREARREGWRSLVLVTTSFHTRRARWIFRKVLGPSVVVHAAAARHDRYEEDQWYRSDEGQLAYFGETLRLIYYWLVY